MNQDRRHRNARLTLLYRCCRRGFQRGRASAGTDALLWMLREHLGLTPYQSARAIAKARQDSLQDPYEERPPIDAAWIMGQARRMVVKYGLEGTRFQQELDFLRADLASPHLAEGSIHDNVSRMISHLGGMSQALPRVGTRSQVSIEVPRWRAGRGLRALAAALAIGLGLVGVVQAWGVPLPTPRRPSADARAHRRTLADLMGREAVGGEDREAEILATYQAIFEASPEGPARRQVREEWAAYLRLRDEA